MSECDVVMQRIPELLTESLAPAEREETHAHLELCAVCRTDWNRFRETWATMEDLPDVPVPQRSKERFSAYLEELQNEKKVVRFVPRRTMRWAAQAAAVVVLVGGSFYAGSRRQTMSTPLLQPTPATVEQITPVGFSIAENRTLPASQMSPDIQGRPEIRNVQFVPGAGNEEQVAVSFDVTSHVTLTGRPTDKSLVNLLSYVLQNQDHPTLSRSRTLEWVKSTYADQGSAAADPEIIRALASVLKNDTHEGVRIKAVETLQSIPASMAGEARAALIDALQNDPNPAVRIKAIDALAKLARTGDRFDSAAVEMLRKKAGQADENTYVRVKAAEALGQINL